MGGRLRGPGSRRRSITDIDVTGKRVLTRVDFNVPVDAGGRITDDRRIRMALPTLRSVLERGGRLVLMSHRGRPKGTGFEADFTLVPVAGRLGELLGTPVAFVAGECAGAESAAAAARLEDGQTLLLDNLRFDPGEKKGDADFAARLAAMGDVYCNDAFGTAHRSHASMVAVPAAMPDAPHVAGLLLQKELTYLADTLAAPARPFVAVLGGAKVSDKLGAIEHLAGVVDAVLVGGAMAYTFLAARGEGIGSSLLESERLDDARVLLEGGRVEIVLPEDHVCAQSIAEGVETRTVVGAIPDGWMGLDIGPATAAAYAARLQAARTIVWNGPMGVFEVNPFGAGTEAVARAIGVATGTGATTIIGGGDSAAAVERLGLQEAFSHVSTGGGASLQMLEGRLFESVSMLDEA
ncbi:MAG: phosphoglycerate kinase [Planctomycetota bacterium]